MQTFKQFVETVENEQFERKQSFYQWLKAYKDLSLRFNLTLKKEFINWNKEQLMKMPIEELRQVMKELPKEIKNQENYYQIREKEQAREEKRNKLSLNIGSDQYYRSEDIHERVVCSQGDPGYDKIGMKAYPMDQVDNKLKGYYGVHVGSGWLSILKRDGYCDSGDAYIYHIHTDKMMHDGIKVYQMEDPHVAYKDINTPDSWIIFSSMETIPAKYIELVDVIPENEIEESPPPYGISDESPW